MFYTRKETLCPLRTQFLPSWWSTNVAWEAKVSSTSLWRLYHVYLCSYGILV